MRLPRSDDARRAQLDHVLAGESEAVADNRVSGLFAALETGSVYAPYDGGADLFFPTGWERDLARERYDGWLSSRPDGL